MRFPSVSVVGLAGTIAMACLMAACSAPQPQTPGQEDAGVEASHAESATTTTPPPAPQAKRAAGQEGEPLLAYRVVGTEPFWGVRVDGDTLHFTTIDDQAGKHLTGTHTLREDGIGYVGKDGATAFELDIVRGECSDGMSDTVYAFKASFRYGDTAYEGCAEQAMAK
jgi:uncharacterized membrane protein